MRPMEIHSSAVNGAAASPARPATIVALAWLLGLLAVAAAQGGIAMIADPITPLGMSPDYLEGTPVDTYFWPGAFLIGIATSSLVTSIGLTMGWRWRWAGRIESSAAHRWPWVGAMATGTILGVFELVELFFVPFHPVMHPLLIAWSAAIVVLFLTQSARSHLAVR